LGPYRIEKVISAVDYKISLVDKPEKTKVVHVDDLKKYEGTETRDPRDPTTGEVLDQPVEDVLDRDIEDTLDEPQDTVSDLKAPEKEDDPDQDDLMEGIPDLMYPSEPDEDQSTDSGSEASEDEAKPSRQGRIRRPPDRFGSWVTEVRVFMDQDGDVLYRFPESEGHEDGIT
jgi:hypothetical protein